MKHMVITIGCEYGSGGPEIGKAIADYLGIEYYDRDLVDKVVDALTGFQFKDGKNQNLLGPGIQGITFGPADPSTNPSPNPSKSSCGAITLLGLQQGKGRWECTKILNPIRWYEKYVEAKKS